LRHTYIGMFYFFKREGHTVTCELRPGASGAGYDIIIVEPGRPVVTEHYTSAAEVHKRWQDLQERFKGEGWWGPTAGL
jgi:hypothetical protein